MPNVEGFTPTVLWTTIYGFIALCILITVVLTAEEKIRKLRQYKKEKRASEQPGLADEISQKVISQLEPRLHEIEEKLDKDKTRLDNHERMISDAKQTNDDIRTGLRAYGKTMLVLLDYGDFGESKELIEAKNELNKFLAERF